MKTEDSSVHSTEPVEAMRLRSATALTGATPEPRRSCGDGCNGCEECTDYGDGPAERASGAKVDGNG
jgi:hypothetical protein